MLFDINNPDLSKFLIASHSANLTDNYILYTDHMVLKKKKSYSFENRNVYTSSEYSTFF